MVNMVFISRSPFFALLGPAFWAALFVFPAKTDAQVPQKSPHGIFELGANAWTNPVADGRRLQIRWTDIQPDSETQFDWSIIDNSVAYAQTYNKQLGISLVLCSAPPAWLTALPGVTSYRVSSHGHMLPMVLPWDPIVQQKIIAFVTQLCLRYDGLVDYIVMGGLGVSTDSHMPNPPEIGLNLTLSEAIAAWTESSNTIIDAYGANLYSTPFIIAGGSPPFRDQNSQTAWTNIVSRAAGLYGQHFGVMDSGLSARSNTGYLTSAMVAQYSSTNLVGLQLRSSEAQNASGQMSGGTLQQALDAGIALRPQWLEIYAKDADDPDNATTLENARTKLASLSSLLPSSPSLPGATKAPHGLFEIGGDAWTNPGISGWKAEIKWSLTNLSEGVYDWSKIDGLVANAVKYKKQLGVSMRILSSPPAWVTSLPGVKTYKSPLGPDLMVLPFDPIVQPKIIAFIKAFCLHFDGKLDFVVMGGLGYKTETYMPLPSQIGLSMTIGDYTTAWINSSDLFIDTYSQNLTATPFVIAGGIPFADPGASAAITTVINHGLLYPLFGITQWGLKAKSNNGFLINKLIQDNDAGRATGFQLTGASDGSVGGDLGGTLQQALSAGAALGADWIEIYAADAMNPAYAPLLLQYNTLLK